MRKRSRAEKLADKVRARKARAMANKQIYLPTEKEIAAKCAKIREGWKLKQWNKQDPPPPVEVQVIRDDRHYSGAGGYWQFPEVEVGE